MDPEYSDMDDDCYVDDDNSYYDDDDMDNDDYNCVDEGMSDSDIIDKLVPSKTYTVLQESEIHNRQEELISQVTSTLFITNAIATTLLYHYKWDLSSLLEDWFADEVKTRAKAGLSDTEPICLDNNEKTETLCEICLEWFPRDDFHFYPSNCGHLFCVTCWTSYITISITDGLGCLSLKCPSPKCEASVCRDMVDKLMGPIEIEKYDRFILGSFMEGNKKAKWCPAPGCENAVEFELGSDVYDVTCLCSYAFCWNCAEEIHRPVDCKTVSNWIENNTSESENTSWILANSKPCPKCNRAIEKNHGCMHMTCGAPCKYEFCWLCLGDWSEHGENTGGFFACNKYEKDKAEGVYNKEESRRRIAKNHLQKYTHYYERWDGNHKSRQKAVQDLQEMKKEGLAKLSECLNIPETEFDYICEALEQIIECRRVLKWTYAYGYYLPDDQRQKKEFFEFIQGEAEANLEGLHQCAEKELSDFFEKEEPIEPFSHERPKVTPLSDIEKAAKEEKEKMEKEKEKRERINKYYGLSEEVTDSTEGTVSSLVSFPQKLKHLTRVTASFFEKLVTALETGMSEVKVEWGNSEGSGINYDDLTMLFGGDDDLNESDYWTCSQCTLVNPNSSEMCQVCNEEELLLDT